jgi:hypothetical protein
MNIYDKVTRFGWYAWLEGSDRQDYGNTWFVDSNGGGAADNANSGQGASWAAAFATLNYAISRCSNDAGDVIFVAANHAESWSTTETASGTTTTGCCVDKSGVTIIGLGTGDRRPTFTFTAAAGVMDVRATEVALYGLIFYSNFANHAASIDAQSGADGLIVEACKFYDASAITETVTHIILTANCNDVTIRGCHFYNTDTNDGSDEAILFEGASHRTRIIDNVFDGDWNEEVINANTAASTEIEVSGNVINNTDTGVASAINFHANATGVVSNNIVYCAAGGTGGGAIVAAGCLKSGNSVTSSLTNEASTTPPPEGGASSLGNHWYVDSGTGAATNDGTSWASAFATLNNAIDAATASNGDVIHIAAGHAEDITGATTFIADFDKIGLTVIGEGHGNARPTFSMKTDAANANFDISAADNHIENLLFKCEMAAMKYFILIDTAADNTSIVNCEFRESAQKGLSCILLGGGDGQADYVTIKDCKFHCPGDGWDNAIEILFDMDHVTIEGNHIRGNFDEAGIELPAGANASTFLRIMNNYVQSTATGVHCIEVEETALTVTGECGNNVLVNDDREAALKPNDLHCYGNIWMDDSGKLAPVKLEGDVTTPGNNVYVNSAHPEAADDAAHGSSWDYPLATIEYAHAQARVVADNNDIIHVGPGHEETITDAVFLDFDVAGVTCIGYGNGTNRPTVTSETNVAAVVDVGASNITIKNFIFRSSMDAVTIGVDILAGATNCKLIDCDFGPGEAASDEFAIALQINAGCNYTEISGCKFYAGAAAAVASIKIEGTSTHVDIHDCVFTGAHSGQCILGGTAASTDLDIHHNSFATTSAVPTLSLVAASTGMVRHNDIVVGSADFATAMDIGNCWNIFNKMIANDDVTGAKCDNRYNVAASVTETADG